MATHDTDSDFTGNSREAADAVGKLISDEYFRAIADCTYDWEYWQSPAGRLLWVNSAVERMTGYRPEECMAMTDYPLPIVAPHHRDRLLRITDAASAGDSGNNVEFQVLHRDRSLRWMAVSWQPMYDTSGCNLGFRASVRDIEEKHELREQLRLHNEHLEQLVQERTARIIQLEQYRLKMERVAALGELAAGVAHEINNPLAGIRNAFALIKSSLPPDTKYYGMLDLIDAEIERISRITHQMHQLYRPSQQRAAKFDLQKTVRGVITLLEPLTSRTGVIVKARCSRSVPSGSLEPTEVLLREDELKQVLFNLIRNAVQASQRGDAVEVCLDLSRTYTKITVSDTGCGIDPETLPQIFDPFFSTKSDMPKQGMGLGLSVSRSLVEAMNGTIDVESRPGAGSCFTIELPRQIEEHIQ